MTITGTGFGTSTTVTFDGIAATDIVPDEDDPYAMLTAFDPYGEQLAQVRVAPTFKLSVTSASAWIEKGYKKP